MKQRIPTAIAMAFGLLTLLGYFLSPVFPSLNYHHVFIRWAAVLAAVAFLLGVVNLFRVHLTRVVDQERDWPYSLALTFAAALVFLVALWEQGTGGPIMGWVFNTTLLPLETASASLLVFFLAAAALRAFRIRPTALTFIFIGTTLLVLLAAVPMAVEIARPLAVVRNWLVYVFGTAGARGMLLGVALGTIATGIRVLVGIDRPHSERDL